MNSSVINLCILCFAVCLLESNAQYPCIDPDGRPGSCISILECPALRQLLSNRNRSPAETKLLQDSRCGPVVATPFVCCQSSSDVRMGSGSGVALLPKKCGQPADDNRIKGGNETGIADYPWMALIEYRSIANNLIKPACGGALITTKYVLTAAHCILVNAKKFSPPLQVRLGEHDTRTSIDCRTVEGGGVDCNEAPVIVAVASYAAHPQYSSNDVRRRHDIGLIRMRNDVTITDFIRPICLPNSDQLASSAAVAGLYVAGWGATESLPRSPVKMAIKISQVLNTACQRAYTGPQYGVHLWMHQACAGGQTGIDSCGGDSGGPLMYHDPAVNSYEAAGVVSFGPVDCGQPGIPGVYTRVFSYRPWILSQLKP